MGYSKNQELTNKKIAKKARERWSDPEYKQRVRNAMKGSKKLTVEQKEAISLKLCAYHKAHPRTYGKEVRKHFREAARRRWNDPAYRKIAFGRNKISSKFNQGWVTSIKCGRIFLQSSWEKLFVKMLDSARIVKKVTYEPFGIDYRYKGGLRTFYPDFLVELRDGTKWVVEIKGWLGKEAQRKFKAASSYCEEHGYEWSVITERPVAPLTEYLQ